MACLIMENTSEPDPSRLTAMSKLKLSSPSKLSMSKSELPKMQLLLLLLLLLPGDGAGMCPARYKLCVKKSTKLITKV